MITGPLYTYRQIHFKIIESLCFTGSRWPDLD